MTPEETAALKAADDALEAPAETEALADAQFEAGFNGLPDAPTEIPPVVEETITPVTEPEVIEPPVAKISEAQFQDLLTKANSVADVRQLMDKLRGDAFGKLGGLERTIKQLQETPAAGKPVDISAEDLAEIHAEFPDLGINLAKGLTRVLGKLKLTPAAPVDVEARIASAVTEREVVLTAQREVERVKERQERALERLSDRHEDWSEVIGAPESATPFRTWLATQEAGYAKTVNETDNPIVVAKALDKFKAFEKEKPAPKPTVVPKGQDGRVDRLKEAIPAKGGSSAPVQKKALTAEEEFELGFKQGRQ